MISVLIKRSSSLGPKRVVAALTSIETILHHQVSSAAPADALFVPRNGGLPGETRHFSVLTTPKSPFSISDNVKVREFHVKSGPLDFKASLASQAEFAVADYSHDEERGSSGNSSEEGLEIAKLGISEEIVSALARKGISKLFPIQKAVLQPAMEGRDMFGRARTGTGKTLAFGIPIIDRILQFNKKHGRGRNPLALVMAPTRELARQVEKEFRESAASLDTICLYGGTPITRQMQELNYGVDVAIGTPGRIIDLMKRGSLNLSEIQFVVLDEADQMLGVGFVDDIETIFQRLPQKRQSMLFSATMPSWIRSLIRNYLKDPLIIDLVGDSDKKLADGITLYSIASDMYQRASILSPLITEHAKGGKCIVFTETKREADRLAYAMARTLRCEALHGDISQSQRERTLSGFRKGDFSVLVATDVAARGLDVPNVDLVIHYAIPRCSETLVHRSGRTGRAGKKGTAILIYTQDETRRVKEFERDIGCRFSELPRITVEGGGIDMFNDKSYGGQFASTRDRRFGETSFGRSGGRSFRNEGFGRSDGFGGPSRFGNNSNRPGNFSGNGFGRSGGFGESGRSDRSSAFGDFSFGRPSRSGDNNFRPGFGSDRPGGFGDKSRSSLFGDIGNDDSNSGKRKF